jgi:membrane protein required for colicin V production
LNYLDYIIFIFLALGFLLGFKDGLVRKIIGLIGFIVAIALAFQFSDYVGNFLSKILIQDKYLADIVAGILIFLVVILITAILKRVFHPLDKVNRFINQFIGGIIGAIQIIFFVSGIFLFINILGIPSKEDRGKSLLYDRVQNVIPDTIDLIIGGDSKATDYIQQFIENKDKNDSTSVYIDSLISK